MQLETYQPFVSIIVPIMDDTGDSSRRLAMAHAQTWHKLEVIPIPIRAISEFSHALNAGLSASRGDFISLLLPGTSYTLDKIAQQVAFVAQFELQNAAVFCNYTIVDGRNAGSELIQIPYYDPAVMFHKIYCGLPIDCSSLLVPREAMVKLGLLKEQTYQALWMGFLLALSQHVPLVGMSASLVSISRAKKCTVVEKVQLCELYARLLPEILVKNVADELGQDIFTLLGEATTARLTQGLPLAAWEIMRAAFNLLGQSSNKGIAFQTFVKPLLRGVWRNLPIGLKRLVRATKKSQLKVDGPHLDFSSIYRDNGFVGTDSLSGAGSSHFQTRVIRHTLPQLFRELGVQSVLDIPCGDFHWMSGVNLTDIHYIGADIVDDMVRSNQQRFGNAYRTFQCVNLIFGPLPIVDLVFCRDCLVHLPYEEALTAIETIRQSKSRWLLTTTFTRTTPNSDLDLAGWRALNLTLPPFNLPPPTLLILEKCTEAGGNAGDKSLGLWRITDLQPCQQVRAQENPCAFL